MTAVDRDDLIWAYLVHLSYNMWVDREARIDNHHIIARPHLRFDEPLWQDLLGQMAEAGINMLVIDLGDGVKYQSHPEIAVSGAWGRHKLADELDRIRSFRIEPIPKLNFSTCHDAWMGPYSRCVSTALYYGVCRDLIAEVLELFDGPRFFHLGMDEETAQHQRHYEYLVIRQFDLWWHDLFFYVDQVEAGGSRAWVWSDYVWHHPEMFYSRMPRSVLQSNWYYDTEMSADVDRVRAYSELEAHGYDQIPTGSNWRTPDNFSRTVQHCSRVIAPQRLFGFMQSVWRPTIEACRDRHEQAIRLLGQARRSDVAQIP